MRAEKIDKYIDYFKDIDSIADEEKKRDCIYFCDDGENDVGFTEPTKFGDLGMHMFIAKKYILEEDLKQLENKSKKMPDICPHCGSEDLYEPNPRTDPTGLGPYCDDCGEKIEKLEVYLMDVEGE